MGDGNGDRVVGVWGFEGEGERHQGIGRTLMERRIMHSRGHQSFASIPIYGKYIMFIVSRVI